MIKTKYIRWCWTDVILDVKVFLLLVILNLKDMRTCVLDQYTSFAHTGLALLFALKVYGFVDGRCCRNMRHSEKKRNCGHTLILNDYLPYKPEIQNLIYPFRESLSRVKSTQASGAKDHGSIQKQGWHSWLVRGILCERSRVRFPVTSNPCFDFSPFRVALSSFKFS